MSIKHWKSEAWKSGHWHVSHWIGLAEIGPPKHCCPYWDCEYIDVETLDGTVTYKCGSDPEQPFFFNARCKRTVSDDDYHRWEYRSEGLIGQTLEVTIECDRRQSRRADGFGPCATITAAYDGGLSLPGVAWCFGPLTMERQCQCLDDEPPGFGHVGFTWGTTTLPAEDIAADPNNDCACKFILAGGNVITVYCTCANCPCFGAPVDLEGRFECADWPGGAIDVVIPLSYVDVTTIPSPFPPYPSKTWYGLKDLGSTCGLELVVDCDFGVNNSGPELRGLNFIVGGSCLIDPVALESLCGLPGPGFAGNAILLSHTCQDDSTDFEAVYGFCSAVGDPVCDGVTPPGGTIRSTLTIRRA